MAGFRSFVVGAVCAVALLVVSATAGGAGLGPVRTTPGLAAELQSLDAGATYGAFVMFDGGTPAGHAPLLAQHNLTAVADFQSSVNAVYAVGTAADIRALTYESAAVRYMEENRRLAFHGDTAVWATRARVAQEAVSGGPFVDAGGKILDGTGVGVAVVDSGINGLHPDLEDRIAKNYKIVCTTPGLIDTETGQCFGPLTYVDVGSTNSDVTGGHGTHVSGIVAGDGRQSTGPYPVAEAAPNVKGTFTGVAPASTLFGYSTGEVISVLYALEAWQHLYDNYDNLRPRIRVANHSFGEVGGATYNPDSIEAAMVKQLVGKGITMVFSAGNEGGAGEADLTSSYCDDPTPGVICVANYNDTSPGTSPTGTGNRDNMLDASSSRGLAGTAATYPDVSAPGSFYTSACIRGVGPVCATGIINEFRWFGFYGSISGTSMASPHVAGISALLLQAKPDLTPAQIEDVLADTAHKFTAGASYEADPQNSGQTTSVDKGAGLVDVPAALKALSVKSLGGAIAGSTASIAIQVPAAGGTVPARGFTASGTASEGSTPAQPVQWIADGDGGDYSGPGAVDIVGLSVQETAGGLTYRMLVRDAMDLGPSGSASLRVTQNVNGLPFTTNVLLSSTGATPGTGTAPATSASLSGNTVTFFVPYANVGNPPAGSPAHNIFASSFIQVIQDYAPSPNPSEGVEINTRPMYGKPYTIAGPQAASAGVASVTVSVDGKPGVGATVTGAGPSYSWSAKVAKLAKGAHTLEATFFLGGIEKASSSVAFTAK